MKPQQLLVSKPRIYIIWRFDLKPRDQSLISFWDTSGLVEISTRVTVNLTYKIQGNDTKGGAAE